MYEFKEAMANGATTNDLLKLAGVDPEEFEDDEEEEDWDEPSDWDLEMGFDPYEGGYTWDC